MMTTKAQMPPVYQCCWLHIIESICQTQTDRNPDGSLLWARPNLE